MSEREREGYQKVISRVRRGMRNEIKDGSMVGWWWWLEVAKVYIQTRHVDPNVSMPSDSHSYTHTHV
jgi:hypothetical protein